MDMRRSLKCFHGWWSYLKLALPSVGACCLEWCAFSPEFSPACRTPFARHCQVTCTLMCAPCCRWLYEGLILMAGWFPSADVAVAAMGVGFNTTALTYTISQGVGGEPCCIRWPWVCTDLQQSAVCHHIWARRAHLTVQQEDPGTDQQDLQ